MDFSTLKYAYAVSGGIGSGKSTACRILMQLGYAVLDCDEIAHSLLEIHQKEVAELFDIGLDQNGTLDRLALGKIVFASSLKRQKLEAFLHPLIAERLWKACSVLEKKQTIYFVEIPLLFEHFHRFNFSHTILVYAPKEVQILRLMERNALSEEEALQRLYAQMPIDEKIQYAEIVFDNTQTQEKLKMQILDWLGGVAAKSL
ncbi:dephospho-CoA kinase [Helicobacter enhydrae]|uniref:Dephospho-CoA kinase n=1 Tax=Helicobacter enhydrae TaxID=222136 RepID=A0A1B1U7C5_9HELI|nr:dephospho-CoA kinase [Helicobacter enhydrae]ANV98707.1 dephospho-CoA kinase [Helicobacter enhydrae]